MKETSVQDPCVPHLDALVESLREAFRSAEGRADGKRIAELLADYAGTHDDWRAFALFAGDTYTRNLVARFDSFEMMVLCWGAGQESPIHNHEDQDCWMAVLEGSIEEVRYPMPDGSALGPLEPRDAKVFGTGDVAFIKDEMGLHLVRPAEKGRPGVSLHVYAEPYDECNCYCPETGRVTRKKLVNHSNRGKLLAPNVG